MAGRGRGEGGRQDSPVSAQGWCGDRCGADGAVGTSGSGRRACRAPREAWGTRVQGCTQTNVNLPTDEEKSDLNQRSKP